MLIPSIDLQGGRIVQLVQGEKLALATDAIDEWIARWSDIVDFEVYPVTSSNEALEKVAPQL